MSILYLQQFYLIASHETKYENQHARFGTSNVNINRTVQYVKHEHLIHNATKYKLRFSRQEAFLTTGNGNTNQLFTNLFSQ